MSNTFIGKNGKTYMEVPQNQPWQGAPYRQPVQQQTPQNTPIYKRSGAVYSKIRKGNFEGDIIVNAWRSTKYGLMQAVVSPYLGQNGKGNEIVNSQGKNGSTHKEYQKMICVIKNTSLGTSQTYHVLMNLKSQVIVIQELSLCITPNGSGTTRKGKRVTGYFGSNFKK